MDSTDLTSEQADQIRNALSSLRLTEGKGEAIETFNAPAASEHLVNS